jgi:hypothetical protein
MNWRRRLVSPKEQSTDACGLALCDRVASEKWHRPHILRWARSPKWVNRVTLVVGRPLPVYPDQRTSSDHPGMSGWCQRTKSLRSSPLRGSKSREAGGQVRGQRWRGGKVNTISSCIIGVQRVIKNSKDHLAGRHPDAASHIDPAITQ